MGTHHYTLALQPLGTDIVEPIVIAAKNVCMLEPMSYRCIHPLGTQSVLDIPTHRISGVSCLRVAD